MINGILNIYKEKGYTSHDVVARLRGIVGQKKIGHTGTLDPEAEGVLPVCLGRATKVCDMLTDKDKTYETVLLLGTSTDTQDITGRVLSSRSLDDPELPEGTVTEEKTESCIRGFIGEYDQIPPMYSALKVGGKKLYELAREGKTIERKSRKVMIYDIRIKDINLPRVRMEVKCSKGTYIRTLCHDIGNALNCCGCMESLLRTQVSRFSIQESLKLSEIQEIKDGGHLAETIIPLDRMFEEYRKVIVKKEAQALAYNGNEIPALQTENAGGVSDREQIRMYDESDHFIGVYQYHADKKRFILEKMFLDQEELRG